ncbi:MAG TPA: CPBP family glutamic-type intramembrane protease, partial [Candidatus Dojkabacteria bacterium]|nr:CPBP family glutamic-type intramembrane protease [Candidatus Dojkabacteria bacterium]
AVFEFENPLARNIIASTLFLLIHIPGWILYSPNLPIYYPLSLFILSLILGYLVQRHKSLIPSVVVHSMNNIFSSILWR